MFLLSPTAADNQHAEQAAANKRTENGDGKMENGLKIHSKPRLFYLISAQYKIARPKILTQGRILYDAERVHERAAAFARKGARAGHAFTGRARNGERTKTFAAVTQPREIWTILDEN